MSLACIPPATIWLDHPREPSAERDGSDVAPLTQSAVLAPRALSVHRSCRCRGLMSNAADSIIGAAIRSAFECYPTEGDPDWRSPSWITPEECAHLTQAIMRALDAAGFQIVQKQS